MQGLQAPVVAHGLLQHETKLSVLNFAVKKDANFSETLQNKTELLFVTGLRWVVIHFAAAVRMAADDDWLASCLCLCSYQLSSQLICIYVPVTLSC